jgi:nucleoside-diphosphate-sugar epimerase
MPNALIGHTGFVGCNLARQLHFDDFYNSKNIESIIGKTYDLMVCAGAPAEKWKANKDPIKDRDNISRLMSCLSKASAVKVILISTIDVYPSPIKVDENTVINPEGLSPYGKHRWELEKFVKTRFDSLIIRLPGLFGSGLKKNIIYDFIHNNCMDQIHADSVFQFYHLDNLGRDIQIPLNHHIKLINFATEPISVREITHEVFKIEFNNRPHSKPAQYDFRTKHDHLFGGSRGYIYNKQQVLSELEGFVSSQGVRRA